MVVFTCNHCGDSLQKPRVDKHYETTCRRNPKSLTCVDCLKDFRLEEYAAHTKCITEEQRYAAKGTVFGGPKGEKKQETWVETVHNVVEEQKSNVSPNIRKVFDLILKHPNIPKKKKPFINYISSSSGRRISLQDIETVWNILETHKQKFATQNGTNKNQDSQKTNEVSPDNNDVKEKNETNETSIDPEKSKKKRKSKKGKTTENEESKVEETHEESKAEETSENTIKKSKKKRKSENCDENKIELETPKTDEVEKSLKKKKRKLQVTAENGKTNGRQENCEEECPNKKQKTYDVEFSWINTIREILMKKSDGMSKDELQNKVFKKYEKVKGAIEDEDKKNLIIKFNVKFNKLKNISCENDIVKITV